MAFLFIYQNTSGPIAWMYAAETTADVAMGTCLLTLWGTVFILTLVCPKLMEPESLGPSAVFYMFSGISIVATLYCYVFIRETYGMTDKQKKAIYIPKGYEDDAQKAYDRLETVDGHTKKVDNNQML